MILSVILLASCILMLAYTYTTQSYKVQKLENRIAQLESETK
jgi:hypothetical protein